MMYAYSISTKRLIVVTVVALAVVIGEHRANAQPSWVLSHQKISDTQGGFTGILNDDDRFGGSLARLGDIDGDGVGDLAVGASRDADGGLIRGAVWVLFLNPDGTVKTHQKISSTQGGFLGVLDATDLFGWSLAALGDLDGDGVGDLAVAAAGDDDGGPQHGAVWVLFLNTDGTVKSHQKISSTQGGFTGLLDDSDFFGYSVGALGDLDGDGIGDLAVGADRDDDGGLNRGAVWVLFLDGISTCPADLNHDGSVGTSDLLILFAFWGEVDAFPEADLDGDGFVNTSDLLILFANWGPCN
ncbi:MAG: FG-GAP repeat protein [Planctomycetes bacterium]|nr:FG-GAP repeat protein [Planctomycetota bacterium]